MNADQIRRRHENFNEGLLAGLRGHQISYIEVDGVAMCLREVGCEREADHDGICVLPPVVRIPNFIHPDVWASARRTEGATP